MARSSAKPTAWRPDLEGRRLDLSLYLVADPSRCGGRPLADVVAAAVAGGVSLVQLRDKTGPTRRLVDTARALKRIVAPHRVPLLINDRVDVALAAGADGVHLGQEDMAVEDARGVLGRDAIIGLTVRSEAEARAVPRHLVDYVSIGAVFPTASKDNPDPPNGLDGLARIAALVAPPRVAIAGIDRTSAAAVIGAGVEGVAVISAICMARDPRAASAELAAIVSAAREGRS